MEILDYKVQANMKAIKTALFDKEITYAEVGRELHISEASVINKLNGRTRFYLDEFYYLSLLIDTDMMSLLSVVPITAQLNYSIEPTGVE